MALVLVPCLLAGTASAAQAGPPAPGTRPAAASGHAGAALAVAAPRTYRINTDGVRQRVGPGEEHTALPLRLNRGSRVAIRCTVRNGRGELWDKVSAGNVYVLDRFVSTGTDRAVMPPCGRGPVRPAPPAPPAPAPARSKWADNDWYFNKAATNLAANDARAEQRICTEMLSGIPVAGGVLGGWCHAAYGRFRDKARDALNTGQCVKWDAKKVTVFGRAVVVGIAPEVYSDDWCHHG